MRGIFVSYVRVSTQKQGENGYGADAQRKAVSDYLSGINGELIAEFAEVESGRKNDRPQLAAALATCRKRKAKLVIAKLDRLARNVAFIANLMNGKVDFVCCDMPSATRFSIHILAAVAEQEREMISIRTKAALAAAKARGVKLGSLAACNAVAARNHKAAAARAGELASLIAETANLSARAAAIEFNRRKIPTPNNRNWSARTVIRVRQRLNFPAIRP